METMGTVDLVYVVAAFFLGSIPFGLIIAWFKGIDLRHRGSGNIGATNVARVIGKGWGAFTLVLDFLKGFLPLAIYQWSHAGGLFLVDRMGTVLGLMGLSAVLGHCFSIFLKGRGGKGVATAAGVILALSPKVFLVAIVVFAVLVKVSGYVSVASLGATLSAPLSLHLFTPSPFLEPFVWLICLVIWFQHRSNIKRLMEGSELGV